MPARYVRSYSKGQKNDLRDAEAIAEAVQRPTMKFVAPKTADQLDLQALHRVRERLVSQRTDMINQIRAFLLERGIWRWWCVMPSRSSTRSIHPHGDQTVACSCRTGHGESCCFDQVVAVRNCAATYDRY